jgi:hypothetical protein
MWGRTVFLPSLIGEVAEAVRFELTDGFPSTVFKTVGLNHSPKPPKICADEDCCSHRQGRILAVILKALGGVP